MQSQEVASRAAAAAARRTLGLVLIFITAAIWIVSSFLSESLVSSSDTHRAAVHPLLLTYLATSLFTLYLPLLHFQSWISGLLERRQTDHDKKESASGSGSIHNQNHAVVSNEEMRRERLHSKIPYHAAAWAMPIWFCAQFTFNLSLAHTTVTSNTIISSTSSLFTFFLSMWLLSETYSSRKLVAIMACIAGTALVTLSDNQSDTSTNHSSIWGDMLAVLSAGLYGGYTVVMRKKMPGEEAEEHVALFFGYVGLFSTVLLLPVILACLFFNVFSLFDIPKEAYMIIVLEGLLDYVLSDYLWARAVMLLGPTVATLGLSVQIPMAAVTDFLLGKAMWLSSFKSLLMTLGGTSFIMFGFFLINLPGENLEESISASTGCEADKLSSDGIVGQDEELQGLLTGGESNR